MAEIRTLSLKIAEDIVTGPQIYEAYQDIDTGNLHVRQLDENLVLVGSAEDFGAASEVEIDSRTYKLALYVDNDPSQTDNEDHVIAYGRMRKT